MILKFAPLIIKSIMLTITTTDIISRIAMAILLGSIVGLERTFSGKPAGMRTYSMVALGSAIFVIIADIVLAQVGNASVVNPLVLAAAVVSGIGFIGAGLLISHNDKIIGLTTAAGLWVSSGIGMAAGFGFFMLAIISTVAALVIFIVLWFLETNLLKLSHHRRGGGYDEENNINKN